MSSLIGDKNGMRIDCQILCDTYAQVNDFENALKYSRQKSDLIEEIWNSTKSSLIAEMQTKYETEKKDNQITLLNKDKEIKEAAIKKQTVLRNSLIGGLILMTLLTFLGYRIYSTRQELKLQTVRNKIAEDLHDDIGSTLNSISIFSELAKEEAGKPIPSLDDIGVSARKVIEAMSDIVWTINPENDTFDNVLNRMRSFAYQLLKAKKIEMLFQADAGLEKISLPMLVRKNFYLIFKEAINNLVKYSNAERALIQISTDRKHIKLSVRDDGVGFVEEKISKGNGLKNMRSRAKEISAQLTIESKAGEGTRVDLILKT